MRRVKALLGLVFLAAGAQPVAAQVSPSTDGEGPSFKLGASVLYDSNVARSSAALAAVRGLARADELYSVFADLNYNETFGAASAYITGVAGYDFYQTNSILNRERIDTEAGLKLRFADCQVLFRGNYARRQSDLQDITQVLTTKNTVEVPVAAVDARCVRDEGFSPYVTASQTWSFNSAATVRPSNYRTLLVDAGVAYRHGSLGEIDVFGQYNFTDFPERLFLIGGMLKPDGYQVDGGGIRVSHTFDGRLQLSATIRYISLDPHLAFEPKFDGLTYEGDVSYIVTPRLQLQFTAIRATNPSTQANTAYSVDESYLLGAQYKLSERLNVGVSARHLAQNFNGAFVIPGVNIRSQTINAITGYLRYDFSRNLSLNLTAGDEKRRADVGTFDYDSGRVGLSITAAF